ncbi:hypothetical protein V1477_010020 [Vespula maculifrons]|uniref:Uncharacterized protein n=1 Tax=Vespula maculifrons TaxID=7453 RepID=A0ABD2CBF3_VESMC
MPFRFGSFGLLSKLEMYKTPLTDCSTVHTVGFRHLETRPVVHRLHYIASTTDPGPTTWSNQTKSITVGLLIAPENITPVPADTRASVLPILPVFALNNRLETEPFDDASDLRRYIEIRGEEEKKKRKKRKESRNMRARENDRTQKKRMKGYLEGIMKHVHV